MPHQTNQHVHAAARVERNGFVGESREAMRSRVNKQPGDGYTKSALVLKLGLVYRGYLIG